MTRKHAEPCIILVSLVRDYTDIFEFNYPITEVELRR